MEMDIYMRRRLVALGGLVLFFILFVLLVKSCGGGDEPPIATTTVGATGTDGTVALSREDYIAQADEICGAANSAVGGLDPTDPEATRDEFRITRDELSQLQSLQGPADDRQLERFLAGLEDVVSALRSKAEALDRGDTASADEAQVAIDTAEVDTRELGDRYGFRDCGQFLDAGQSPADAAAGTDTGAAPTDTGAVAPTDTGGTTVTPPADTDTGTDTGGDTGDTGGITP